MPFPLQPQKFCYVSRIAYDDRANLAGVPLIPPHMLCALIRPLMTIGGAGYLTLSHYDYPEEFGQA